MLRGRGARSTPRAKARGTGACAAPRGRSAGPLLAAGLFAASLFATGLFAAGCSGAQSALEPAGRDAEQLARLFWGMTIGSAVIWLVVVALALFAIYSRGGSLEPRGGRRLIVVGGVVVPVVVLAGLLTYGLAILPEVLATAPEGSPRIEVTGLQWWWRVRYFGPTGEPIELANEIRLPVGVPVDLHLESADVIHALWLPALGGKMDMIPGRRTRLRLHPERTGVFRGVCAEYCGTAHAMMMFYAVVEEAPAYERWLAGQAAPARNPAAGPAARGRELFLAHGCGACHTIRGTPADGVIGPDLTHVGSRLSIGAGVLGNDRAAIRRWIESTSHVKPSVHMPAFGMLPPDELDALAAYLESLE